MNCEQQINIFPENGEQRIGVEEEKGEKTIGIVNECVNLVCPTEYEQLKGLPQINGVELKGNKTTEDLGIESDKNYVHMQTTASDTWVITHNLDKLPSVTVIDSAEEEVVGEIRYDNNNQITIKFMAAFKGKATLN